MGSSCSVPLLGSLKKGCWNLPASAIDDYRDNLYDMKKIIPVLAGEVHS
jgi:hypothetical protein